MILQLGIFDFFMFTKYIIKLINQLKREEKFSLKIDHLFDIARGNALNMIGNYIILVFKAIITYILIGI